MLGTASALVARMILFVSDEPVTTGILDEDSRLTGSLEELNGALVLLRLGARLERAEVPPLPCLRIRLTRIKPILARF